MITINTTQRKGSAPAITTSENVLRRTSDVVAWFEAVYVVGCVSLKEKGGVAVGVDGGVW